MCFVDPKRKDRIATVIERNDEQLTFRGDSYAGEHFMSIGVDVTNGKAEVTFISSWFARGLQFLV